MIYAVAIAIAISIGIGIGIGTESLMIVRPYSLVASYFTTIYRLFRSFSVHCAPSSATIDTAHLHPTRIFRNFHVEFDNLLTGNCVSFRISISTDR